MCAEEKNVSGTFFRQLELCCSAYIQITQFPDLESGLERDRTKHLCIQIKIDTIRPVLRFCKHFLPEKLAKIMAFMAHIHLHIFALK
jgi:hypothetical protein